MFQHRGLSIRLCLRLVPVSAVSLARAVKVVLLKVFISVSTRAIDHLGRCATPTLFVYNCRYRGILGTGPPTLTLLSQTITHIAPPTPLIHGAYSRMGDTNGTRSFHVSSTDVIWVRYVKIGDDVATLLGKETSKINADRLVRS